MDGKLSRRSFALGLGTLGALSFTGGAATYSAFTDSESATATITAAEDFGTRLNSGGSAYTANDGIEFESDAPYTQSTGTTSTTTGIARTKDDDLYQSQRTDTALSYEISPLSDGSYDLLFHFAEIDSLSEGQRVFDLYVEGDTVVDSLDIADVVGTDTALVVGVQDVSVTDSSLSIASSNAAGSTAVSAIEVVDAPHAELPYTQVDASPAGDAIIDQQNLVIHAAGTNVWSGPYTGTYDEYAAIVEEDVSGDLVAETGVTIQEDPGIEGDAQAGIMVRNDASEPRSSLGYVSIHRAPDDSVHLMWDSDDDGYVDTAASATVTGYPTDLRLRKSGETFTGYYSTDDGATWTQVGSAVTMSSADSTQDWGLYASSHEADTRQTASFDRFDTYADSTPPTAPANLRISGHAASWMDLAWDAATDSESGVDHYNVYVDGSKDKEVPAGTTTTRVSSVLPGTEYDFVVTAVDAAGNESPDSNTVTQTTHRGPGPRAYWPLDVRNGNSTPDSANGYDARLRRGARIESGRDDSVLELGSGNQYADAQASVLDTSADYSVAAWVRFDDTSTYRTAVSQDGQNLSAFYLQYRADIDAISFACHRGDDTNEPFVRTTGPTPTTGDWYHLVGVHDAGSDELRLYVDGDLEDTVDYADGFDTGGNTVLGRALWNGNEVDHLDGALDDVRLYDRQLGPGEIADLADS